MIHIITPSGVETIDKGFAFDPIVRLAVMNGHHVVDQNGRYYEPPMHNPVTWVNWDTEPEHEQPTPLFDQAAEPTWWQRFKMRHLNFGGR